ncbi:hypothetical protein Scep_024851 [Stephania cephalantha]|uniref:Uncharacterized protein n=1 Tax=Stephania cephalantha TaxID=152367 RepID=A0AAP0EXB3_9MAGN
MDPNSRIWTSLYRSLSTRICFRSAPKKCSARRWRDSHHGSREFVRWGSEDLRRPSCHSKRGGYRHYLRRSPIGVRVVLVPGRGAREEESGFRPSALREATGSIMPVAGTPVHEFDDSGSKATPRKRLVKKSGDRERTPDFGIEDEKPAFMRDEFASEPPSSQKRKGSKEDGFRKKEKKLKGDKKFDKGGKMSSKGGSLSAIYPGRDREMKEFWDTVAGADSEDDQEGVRTMDDDNFIDDTGVDPAGRAAVTNEGFIGDAPHLRRATN